MTESIGSTDADLPAISASAFLDSVQAVGSSIQYASRVVGQENERAGWRDEINAQDKRHAGNTIALIHSEASEMLETLRYKTMPESSKLPGLTAEEEECADLIIRSLDYANLRGLRIGKAVMAKMIYNRTRTTRHGKDF